MKPDLFNSQLDLLKRVVLHCFRNKFGVNFDVFIRSSSRSDLIKKFAEVKADWKINKNALIQTGVVISINWLDILELRESSKWVSSAHKFFNGTVSLKTFNHKDNIINLISVKHHCDERAEWI